MRFLSFVFLWELICFSFVPFALVFAMELPSYRIGDEWNRVPVKDMELTSVQQRLYKATAVGGLIHEDVRSEKDHLILYSVGSGFLIHTKSGSPAIATALHVFADNAKGDSSEKACREMVWYFPQGQKVYYKGRRLLFKNEVLDFALCELDLSKSDRNSLGQRGLEFESEPLPMNRSLATIGFGVFQNPHPGQALMEASVDCRNFLPSWKASLRADIWSLPTGCDASPADSGSAVVDAESGKVVGVLWGTSPVKQMSLMTPSQKIIEALKRANLL